MPVTRVPNEPPADTAPPPERPAGRQARPTGGTTTGTATSRASLLRPAVRKAALARLALSGASGSGKTWTALCIATRLTANTPGARIAVIDTEPADGRQGAAALYADRFSFDTIEWHPPYDPRDLTITLRELYTILPQGSVVIIDSASHFWRGEGGTLDQAGGRFTGWKEATPMQNDFVDAMLRAPYHVVCCTRAKQDYAQQLGSDGKQEVVKLGLNPIQRDDLEYEFQVVVMMDQHHVMEVGKTRAAPLAGQKFTANHQGEFADAYAEWLELGVPLATMQEIDAVRRAVGSISDPQRRVALKREFKAEFGEPENLTTDRLPEVNAWLEANGLPEPPPPPAQNVAEARQELAHAAASPPPAPNGATPAPETPTARTAPQTEAPMADEDQCGFVIETTVDGAFTRSTLCILTSGHDGDHEPAPAVTVETLKDRIAAIEGKARAKDDPPADEETAVTADDEDRWVSVWEETIGRRLVELSEHAQELGLPAGGNKQAVAERVARELFTRGHDPRPLGAGR